MIVDSSAVLAIYLNEPEAPNFTRKLLHASMALISAANYVEVCLKVDRDPDLTKRQKLERIFRDLNLEIVPITVEQAHLARAALQRYGRGSGHAANLNFGDSFAYALSKDTGLPLLFKGEDFIHTDVVPA